MGDGNTETDEETSGDKHLEVDGDCLQSNTQHPGSQSELTAFAKGGQFSYMIKHPMKTPMRRPRISAAYGTTGMATREPIAMIQLRRPRIEPEGWVLCLEVQVLYRPMIPANSISRL